MPDHVLAEGRFLRLLDRDGWELVTRRNVTGIVAIIAVTPDLRLILTEQFRPPVGRMVIDPPAGLAGDIAGEEHEEMANAARRELLEEAGYEASTLEQLATSPVSPGLSDEVITFFFASGLRKVAAGGGVDSEKITVHEVPLEDLHDWCRDAEARGVMIDLKLYAGLHLARSRLRQMGAEI